MVRVQSRLATVAGLIAAAAATITVNSPSQSSYWVQFQSNTIAWSYTPGDPSPVSLQIINGNPTILNGIFSIDEYVDLSKKQYTISNVTLKIGDGFIVQMTNATNNSIIYAQSPQFSVRPNGTTPAPASTGVVSASASATGPSGSAAASGSAGASSSSSASPSASAKSAANTLVTGLNAVAVSGMALVFAIGGAVLL